MLPFSLTEQRDIKMLISDTKDRQKKAHQNRSKIIEFLLIHTYTNIDTLKYYLGVNSKPMISRHLSKLIEAGYVKKAEIKNTFGRVTLFGITQKAINNLNVKPFVPSKVNLRTLEHTLYCQKTSAYYLNHDYFKKHNMELINLEIGDITKYGLKHRPDILLKPSKHSYICIEVELSLKSKPRYKKILSEYSDLLAQGKILQVVYVFYDKKKSDIFKDNILNKLKIRCKDKIKVRLA